MITLRTLFVPLFLYVGIATGYMLAEVGSLDPSVVCAEIHGECSKVATEIFSTRLLSVEMFPPGMWHIEIADVLVVFAVIALVASGVSRVRSPIGQPLSIAVLVSSVWLFVAHPLYSNSLFFILIFASVMGLLHDAVKSPERPEEQQPTEQKASVPD